MTTLADIHAIAAYCPYRFANPNDDDGFVALGADLEVPTLLYAYLNGVFPWFNEGMAPMWWCPNPRCVMDTATFKPAKTLVRTAKKQTNWHISLNMAFDEVMKGCALPRNYTQETWITADMQESYSQLHRLGVGFSVEVWNGKPMTELVGGLYGLKIGAGVFGESMFHKATDASKIVFWALNKWCAMSGVPLIDCQLPNAYLLGLGAHLIAREDFLACLKNTTHQHSELANRAKPWHFWQTSESVDWLYS